MLKLGSYEMKNKNTIIILFPIFIMLMVNIILSSKILNLSIMSIKEIITISVFLIFPLLFFLQGIVSVLSYVNIFLSLVISLIGFSIFMFINITDSLFIYIIIYSLFYMIGFFITKLFMKTKI